MLLTDLDNIGQIAIEKEAENDAFMLFLKQQDGMRVDRIVHGLNQEIAPAIDCTVCGNCCKSLLSITNDEIGSMALHLGISSGAFKEKYIEESEQGLMVMNSIPCHFLTGTRCSVYQHRFTQCREFPHLHKPDFKGRLFGTLMYYAACPIIFNVVEKLKELLEFNTSR